MADDSQAAAARQKLNEWRPTAAVQLISSPMDLAETTSYLLALSPLIALSAIALQVLWTSLMKEPLVQMVVNTTLVVLKSTEVVWKPLVSGILGVAIPIGMLTVAAVKTLLKGLVRMAILVYPHVVSLLRTLRSAGIDLAVAVRQVMSTLAEFASSLAIVMKAIGKGLYYAITGLSAVITSLDQSLRIVRQLILSPGSVTWDDLSTALLPLGLTLLLICFVIWSTRPHRRPTQRPPQKIQGAKDPRRSDRIARRKAMLLSGDLSPLLPPCQEASATPPNL